MDRPPIQQLVTFLYTADLAATGAFYEDLLGLEMVLDQGACRIYRVSTAAFVGFCQHLEKRSDPKGVILTLVSDQVDAWFTNLVAKGLTIEQPPAHNPRFNIYHFFVRDPNGYLIEIQRFLDPAWPG